MSDIAKAVGQRIRNYRTQKGLSQEKLAELSGCHPTYIGQLERGEKNATLESIERIAAALGISLSKLFEKLGGQDNDPPNVPQLNAVAHIVNNLLQRFYPLGFGKVIFGKGVGRNNYNLGNGRKQHG